MPAILQKDPVVLMVEDDPHAVQLLRLSLLKAGFGNRVIVCCSTEEAMKYLLGLEAFSDRLQYPLPQLILLDLKLTGQNGTDFIRWLRALPPTRLIPVVVMTGSALPEDLANAYQAGADSYLTKGNDAHQVLEQMEAIGSLWLRSALLPRGETTHGAPPLNHSPLP
jgi:two-component system, response regulator